MNKQKEILLKKIVKKCNKELKTTLHFSYIGSILFVILYFGSLIFEIKYDVFGFNYFLLILISFKLFWILIILLLIAILISAHLKLKIEGLIK